MHPPFTVAQFFDVFRRYNEAVWPAQIGLLATGLVATFAACRANAHRSWRWAQVTLGLLAALWLWTGIVYFKHFFATIALAGQTLGSLFIAQAGLLLIAAWQNGSSFERTSRPNMIVGATVLAYAFVIYPALGMLLGHYYPAVPSFGTPCPTTIFTFGVFCLLPASIPRFAVAIPVLWSLLGLYAAVAFGVREDLGLVAAMIAGLVVLHHPTRRAPVTRLAV